MTSKNKQIFVFDMTRHRSHLFFRYLGTHPDVRALWHPFLSPFLFGPERMTLRTRNINLDGQQAEWIPPTGNDTYENATNKFLHAVEEAKTQNKILVANEHSQMVYKQDITLALIRNQNVDIPVSSNPTVIPNHIFDSLVPVFVIRNPIHAVPSNYIGFKETSKLRPGGEDWKLITGVPLQRRLFDHFRERNNGKYPLVVDGDDVVWRTAELRDNLCQALDLDSSGISSSWDVTPQDKRHEHSLIRYFLQTIDDSTGIEYPSGERPEANLDKAYEKWVGEYEQEVADLLRSTAEENMPHYEYMAQFKL